MKKIIFKIMIKKKCISVSYDKCATYLWYQLKANYTLIVKFITSNSKYKSIFLVVFPKAAKHLTLYHLRSCPSGFYPKGGG